MSTPDAYHPQVTLWLGGQVVAVDAGIALLVAALARAGFSTFSSCQNMAEAYNGYPATAQVGFTTKEQGQRFAKLVGGQLIEPIEEDFETDEYDAPRGSVGVLFPAAGIGRAVEKVDGLPAPALPGE